MKKRIGWRSLARYLAGESSREESDAVNAWRNQDARHEELLETSRRAWEAAGPDATAWDVEAAWQRMASQLESEGAQREVIPLRRRPQRVYAWAAAIAFALALPAVWSIMARRNDTATFATTANEQRTIRLEDGSIVRLAGQTRLRVSRRSHREAWLEGTAFFGVAERRDEPFVVHTRTGIVRVLGTRFELRASDERVRLAVLEGRVELTGAGQQALVEAGQVSQAEAGSAPSSPQVA